MSDRLEAHSGQGGSRGRQECERRAAPDHRLSECRPGKGVIKEAGQLKHNPPRLIGGTSSPPRSRRMLTAWLTSASESARLMQASWLIPQLVSAFPGQFLEGSRSSDFKGTLLRGVAELGLEQISLFTKQELNPS